MWGVFLIVAMSFVINYVLIENTSLFVDVIKIINKIFVIYIMN